MKKWWIWLAVVAVAAGGVGVLLGWPASPVTVRVQRLQPRRVEQTVACAGTVEAGEPTAVLLPVGCVLEQVYVEAGQPVEKGDVLALVDKEATRKLLADQPAALVALASLDSRITAPETGILVAVKGKTGEVLEMGTPCAMLARREDLQVSIAIREKDLPSLEPGMRVHVTGDGFDKERYLGTLAEISSTAGASGTGAVVAGTVTLEKGQADASLRLGLTAKASIVTAVNEEALVVPYAAVISDEDGRDYIYVLEGGMAHRRPVDPRAQLGEGLLVEDETLAGALVILQPEQIKGDGMAVVSAGEEPA